MKLIQKLKSKIYKTPVETSLKELKWLKENFTRNDSEQFLKQQQVGVFVIRKSESIENAYVLSVKVPIFVNHSRVAHYVLIKSKDGYHIRGCQKVFKDIEKLVFHCSYFRDMLPVQLELGFYELKSDEQNSCLRSKSLNSISSNNSDFSDISDFSHS